MREHLKSGHRLWAHGRDREQFFVDLHAPPFNLKPLPLHFLLLNVPFLPLGRYNGYISLAKKELASPYRLKAAAYFNAETDIDVRREQRHHQISRWLWSGDVAEQDQKNILRAGTQTRLFDFPLEPVIQI